MISKKEILEAFVEAQTEGVWPRKIAVGNLLHDYRFLQDARRRVDQRDRRQSKALRRNYIIEQAPMREFSCLACLGGVWQIREGSEEWAVHIGVDCRFSKCGRRKAFDVVEGFVYGWAS